VHFSNLDPALQSAEFMPGKTIDKNTDVSAC
jgi:hypothetical protein